jgi:hypothetical protein
MTRLQRSFMSQRKRLVPGVIALSLVAGIAVSIIETQGAQADYTHACNFGYASDGVTSGTGSAYGYGYLNGVLTYGAGNQVCPPTTPTTAATTTTTAATTTTTAATTTTTGATTTTTAATTTTTAPAIPPTFFISFTKTGYSLSSNAQSQIAAYANQLVSGAVVHIVGYAKNNPFLARQRAVTVGQAIEAAVSGLHVSITVVTTSGASAVAVVTVSN